jgi:uncharacterized protein (TIGR01777 family)
MSRQQFVTRAHYPVPAAELFAWHTRPGAFERLLPPWDMPRSIERRGGIEDGARTTLGLHVGGLPVRFEVEHFGLRPGVEFSDRQVHGPFAHWQHTHRVVPDGAGALLEDHVEYELPVGPLGQALGGKMIERRLAALFGYRQRRLLRDLGRHHALADVTSSTIAVTGASGFIGRALAAFLTSGGHRVLRIGRHAGSADVVWDIERQQIDSAALEGVDAVVHLAGENIGGGRWTAARKRAIRESRVRGTDLLARALAGLRKPPEVLVSASAVGFYGNAPLDEPRTETSPPGNDFLAETSVAWEAAAAPARDRGIRVVHPRFASLMHPTGGALERLLPIFRAGLGGRIGSGEQPMSWVTLDDAIGAIHRAIFDRRLEGPVNVSSPQPTTNAGFTAALAQALGRPAVLPVPGLALRLAFGEMGEALLLGGAAVLPMRLSAIGFELEAPALLPALEDMLGRGPAALALGPQADPRPETAGPAAAPPTPPPPG